MSGETPLEDVLQRREVDDGELAEDGERDGDDEHAVRGQTHLGQDQALLRPEKAAVKSTGLSLTNC